MIGGHWDSRRQTSERARYAFYSYPLSSHAAAAAEKRKSTDDGKKSRVGRWEKKHRIAI